MSKYSNIWPHISPKNPTSKDEKFALQILTNPVIISLIFLQKWIDNVRKLNTLRYEGKTKKMGSRAGLNVKIMRQCFV